MLLQPSFKGGCVSLSLLTLFLLLGLVANNSVLRHVYVVSGDSVSRAEEETRSRQFKFGELELKDIKPVRAQDQWNAAKAESIIETFLHHHRLGMTQENITRQVFKMNFRQPQIRHCYPFVCTAVFSAISTLVIKFNVRHRKRRAFFLRGTSKNASILKPGDVVFVKSPAIHFFCKSILPNITVKFILVTHGGDYPVPRAEPDMLDLLANNLLIKWFALCPYWKFPPHPKVSSLPYGIASYYGISEKLMKGIPKVYSKSLTTKEADQRPQLVFMNYLMSRLTRPEITKAFEDAGLGKWTQKNLTKDYYDNIARSKFVLSPRGNSVDCYRTYEAILLGAVPIVQNISHAMYRDVFTQAPVYVLKEDHLKNPPTKQDLLDFQDKSGKGRSVVLAQYWLDQIEEARMLGLQENDK